jgi:hypothetical protein
VPSESEKRVVTPWVMSDFFDLSGAPRACVDFRDATDFSRVITASHNLENLYTVDGYYKLLMPKIKPLHVGLMLF